MNMHSLLQAVRDVDNRHCSECEAQIGDVSTAFAVLDFGVWVCNECANSFMETDALTAESKLKTCVEDWTHEEVDHMLKATSNKAVNAIYERHISRNWDKVTPESTRTERVNWILAKYKAKMFIFPERSVASPQRIVSNDGSIRPSMDFCPDTTELPLRLLDFFAVVTMGEQIPPMEDEEGEELNSKPPTLEDVEFTPIISSCIPEPESIPDTPLPEHLGMFIYPNGAHLSSKEVPPTFFTFVLTDTSGVKLYGGVLHIYELAGPTEVRNMMDHIPASSKFVYVPKALVVLSHYPFFNLFYNILKQFYRISLSSCPLPMEKYISYMIQETPLPPPGCTRVAVPLTDSVIMVSRPPRNQLPMVDFSYRPLFTLLSVKNILTVFSFICAEHKVCFASKYLSLLTPVQESFLSFLFPLVWQGAYIPVMPATMLDLLDAPVPMLLGVERCQIFDGKNLKPYYGGGVVIVDLDRDEILVGCDDFGKKLEPVHMHAKDVGKLKDKLVEFGGCVHKVRNSDELVEETLRAFPDNEHLQPIRNIDSSDDGVRIPFVTEYETDEGVSVQASHYFQDKAIAAKVSLLSPRSNTSKEDNFNAKEIRRAFLRFFVSSLRDMHSDNIRNDSSHGTSEALDPKKNAAKKKKKDQPELTKFMTDLMNTQMYTFFSEERIFHPDHAEVKFFDESIVDKLNRSVTTVNKMTTPFLDDKSELIHELYICLPCRGENNSAKHVYPRFPDLSRSVKYTKKAKVLQREAEHRRKLDTKNQQHVVDLAVTANTEKVTRRSSISLMRKESVMELAFAEGESNYNIMMSALLVIQAQWRASIVRKHYLRKRAVVANFNKESRSLDGHSTTIQKMIRRFICRVRFLKCKAATTMQAIVRCFTKRRQYQRARRGVLALQALLRMQVAKKSFKKQISNISRFKAIFLGRRSFIDIRNKKEQCVAGLRAIIFQLWVLSQTQLDYRSKFWVFVNEKTFLHLSLLIDEVKRLWTLLKYDYFLLRNLNYPEVLESLDKLEKYVESKMQAENVVEGPTIMKQRKKFYMIMKSGIKDSIEQKAYFEKFGIINQKKRKQNLSNSLLWTSVDTADASSTIVLDLLDSSDDKDVWIKSLHARRSGSFSVVRIVQTYMQLQQRLDK